MSKHEVTNRSVTITVEATITDKTIGHRLERDIQRHLERIAGVTVHEIDIMAWDDPTRVEEVKLVDPPSSEITLPSTAGVLGDLASG